MAPELLADLLGHKDTRMVHHHYRHPVTPSISVARDHVEAALGFQGVYQGAHVLRGGPTGIVNGDGQISTTTPISLGGSRGNRDNPGH